MVDAVVTNVVEDWGPLLGEFPELPIRARSWVMRLLISVKRSVEPEDPEAGGETLYKIQSANHFFVQTFPTPTASLQPPAIEH